MSLMKEEENPWNIQSLYDLQYFNCPACPSKHNIKQEFINHAHDFHPESEEFLKNITDGSLSDVEIPFETKLDLKYEFENDVSEFDDDDIKTEDCEDNNDDMSSFQEFNNANEFEEDELPLVSKIQMVIKKYKCEYCSKKFRTKNILDKHTNGIHVKGIKCPTCDKEFGLNSDLNRHIKIVHEKQRDYKCDICEKGFASNYDLNRHVQRVHEKGEKSYNCHHCEKIFKLKADLKTHIRKSHKALEKTQCKICNKLVLDLEAHTLRKHDQNDWCQCDHCGKEFYNRLKLSSHVYNVHTGREADEEQCNICQKMYRKCNLKQHIKAVHEKIRDYICENCGMEFSSKATLDLHSVVHTSIRAYKCDLCSKTYKQSCHLSTHKKTVHEGRKDHRCTHCGKAFGRSEALKLHTRTVHEGIKKWKCNLCNNAYGQSHELKKHLVGFHKKEIPKNRNIFELQREMT